MSLPIRIPSDLRLMTSEQRKAFKAKYERMTIKELWDEYNRVIARIEQVHNPNQASKNETPKEKKKREDKRSTSWFTAQNNAITSEIILEVLGSRGEDVGE